MLSRTVTVPTLLAASVAVPYAATNAPQWRGAGNGAAATAPVDSTVSPTAAGLKPPPAPPALPQIVGPGANLFPASTPLEGAPSYSLTEVLRFDVTKEWVYQRWPRKSTGLAELDLYGVRVPLVTGTQLTDLAGSLTYFFDYAGRVQRISFRGRTGDTTQLIYLAAQRFGLTAQPALAAGEQLLEVRRGQDVISRVRTRPAAVLWSSSPHDSFTVELELQDPSTGRPLPSETVPLPPAATAAKPPDAGSDKPSDAEAKPQTTEDPWKAFFPRRQVPKGQIGNLDRYRLYP